MKVLVAMERRAYREAIGYAIQGLRPHVEAVVCEPSRLPTEMARIDPQLVISNQPSTAPGNMPAWVELRFSDTEQMAKICIGGQHTELADVELEDLLSIIDRTERLIQSDPDHE